MYGHKKNGLQYPLLRFTTTFAPNNKARISTGVHYLFLFVL